MVTIFLAPTAFTGTWQERVATPSICTVQAPHWAMPQPYLVPVRPSVLAQHPQKRRTRIGVVIERLAVDVEDSHPGLPSFGSVTGA